MNTILDPVTLRRAIEVVRDEIMRSIKAGDATMIALGETLAVNCERALERLLRGQDEQHR